MLKQTITYNDLDGNPITEDFWFNLSKADLVALELSAKGGFSERMQQIIEEEDGKQLIAMMDDLISKAYGVRSEDNKRFIKSEEAWQDFKATDAYSELMFSLYTEPGEAAKFMNGLVPNGMLAKALDELPQDDPRRKQLESVLEGQVDGTKKKSTKKS